MTYILSPLGGAGWQFFDNSGNILAAGRLYTYAAGSTTPVQTWADKDGVTSNGVYVQLDSAGRPEAQIWIDESISYKFVAKTAAGAEIRTYDYISGSSPASFSSNLASTSSNKGAGLVGFSQTATYSANTVGRKLQQFVNVRDYPYSAAGDGVTDDYTAFQSAFANAPFGSVIDVPYTANGYYLSADPDDGSKAIIWNFAAGVQLSGPGIGSPGTGAGTFGSLYTNPWLRVDGKYNYSDLTTLPSPTGGAVTGDSYEYKSLSSADSSHNITGTITNGSYTMTAISDISDIYPGDAILAVTVIGGWPAGTTRTDCMRVVAVNTGAGTLTFGPDDGSGSGVAVPTVWAGSTTSGATFTIRRRQWMAGWYSGMDTGTDDNVDVHYELWNPVMNITGAAGIPIEINLNAYADTADYCRGLFITGGGTTKNTKLIGIDIQRGGNSDWSTGISLRKAQVGIFLNAAFPIEIDTTYDSNIAGDSTIGYGIHFNNASALFGSLFEGKQLTDGSSAITLQRFTDTSPTGNFLRFKNAANNADLVLVDADGALVTYAPSSSRSSGIAAGSIECNGITLRGSTNLRLGQAKVNTGDVAINGYITIYDSNNAAVKLATVA